ncbi:hypothetical protein BayCH28_01050 [Mycolicibacterium sp. CH28]|uniref:hypothetical protein n=1 Tax=Mycolicibacterium sp. CH28 TaxID=2512237 RepID=UPI0010812AC2|nr:hypothetical protein [Mycolicibacterium sp. CH28]TGD90483.1 hypothetical protein BayCH28_01050 [Mycolicibacterium sp. CH28]
MDTVSSGPAWRSPTADSSLPALVALALTMAMQLAIPKHYTLVPRWPLIVPELLLFVVLAGLNPLRLTRHTITGRTLSLVLLGAITFDNTASAILLDWHIITGKVGDNAALLIGSGAAIFVTNVLVFGIWYWELDRGGPIARSHGQHPNPDFLFPQMASPELAPKDWAPRFLDYLYLSITNVMAFSPTDTMPLARWAKAMMALQAMVAVSMLALVFARAVNVLS